MDHPEDNRLRDVRMTFKAADEWGVAPARLLPSLKSSLGKNKRAKVFKSGNSLALRLPAGLGLEAGMEMELQALPDGRYTFRLIDAPKERLDISAFWGKAPSLLPPPRLDFEERPSTLARRKAQQSL